jgi:hypothetical protein
VCKGERRKERCQRASHPKQQQKNQECLQFNPNEREVFVQKKGKAAGELLTNKNQVLARWKDCFEEHLNEGSGSEQPKSPVDLRDDGVDIDLPSRAVRK